jgi:hypothetical protein
MIMPLWPPIKESNAHEQRGQRCEQDRGAEIAHSGLQQSRGPATCLL